MAFYVAKGYFSVKFNFPTVQFRFSSHQTSSTAAVFTLLVYHKTLLDVEAMKPPIREVKDLTSGRLKSVVYFQPGEINGFSHLEWSSKM